MALNVRSVCLSLLPAVVVGAILSTPAAARAGTYSVLYSFTGKADGARPTGVVMDSAGNIYGQTDLGGDNCPDGDGVHGCGVVFRLSAGGKFKVLATFEGASNGANGFPPDPGSISADPPSSTVSYGNAPPLVLAEHTLYGATPFGGAANLGVVFSVKTDGSEFTILHQFSGADGAHPSGALAVDKNRNVFGVTWQGGPAYSPSNKSSGFGVLFEIHPDGTYTSLYSWPGSLGGFWPSGVVLDASDNVFGGAATFLPQEGSTDYGYLYEFHAASASMTTLDILDANEWPMVAGRDTHGNLFGFSQTDYELSSQYGRLFELEKSGGKFNFVSYAPFPGSDNEQVDSGIYVGSGGLLTAVRFFGPPNVGRSGKPIGSGYGSIYQNAGLAPTDLFDFPSEQSKIGANPNGPIVVTSSGAIVGSTAYGSTHCALAGEASRGCGVLFSFAP